MQGIDIFLVERAKVCKGKEKDLLPEAWLEKRAINSVEMLAAAF